MIPSAPKFDVFDAIARFDERVRSFGDPEPPSSPVTLRAACGYLLRRATPALVPVVAAVVTQFVLGSTVAGALLVAGSGAAAASGVAAAAMALDRRLTALAAIVVAVGLLVVPAVAFAGREGDLFPVQTGLFSVVGLFVAGVCYVETARVARESREGGPDPAGE